MKLRTKWPKRFLATLLSASLVLVNDSVYSVALENEVGEEITFETNSEVIQQYDETNDDGDSQINNEDDVLSNAGDPTDEESGDETGEESGEEQGEEPDENTEVDQDVSQNENPEDGQGAPEEGNPEEGLDGAEEQTDGDENAPFAGMMMLGAMLGSAPAEPNDFEAFGPTEDYPIMIELATQYFERGDGDFPIIFDGVSDENKIDGYDLFKARFSDETQSVSLSWANENRPTQICVKIDENNWDIRDIVENQTSIEINISGKNYLYIEAKYGNDYDNFGSTEAYPILIEIATQYYDRGGGEFPITIDLVSEENMIDGYDLYKARFSDETQSFSLSWTNENRPTQICVKIDENNWDIKDIGENQTSIAIDISGKDYLYIEAKYGNDYDNFGPSEEYPIVVEVRLNPGDIRRGEDSFPVSINDVSGENMIDGGDRIKARVAYGEVTLSWLGEETRPTQICIEGGDDNWTEGGEWEIRDTNEGATSTTITVGEKQEPFYFIEAKYGNAGPEAYHVESPDHSFEINISNDGRAQSVEYKIGEGQRTSVFGESVSLPNISAGAVITFYVSPKEGEEITHFGISENGTNKWDGCPGDVREALPTGDGYQFTVSATPVNVSIDFGTPEGGNPGGGNNQNIDVDFSADFESFNGDDALEFQFDIKACQGDGGKMNLEESGLVFGKNKSQNYSFHLSVPDRAVSLAFHLSMVEGSKLDNAYYQFAGETESYNLSSEQMNQLLSDGYFNVSIKDDDNWKGKLTFCVRIADDDQGGGGQGQGGGGGDMDVTYSEDTTISENLTKNDVTANDATLTIGENGSLRIDHKLAVVGSAKVVGTSASSKLIFAPHASAYGLDLYYNDAKISGGPSNSFENQTEGPSEFVWDATTNKWVTDHDPTSGGDAPWYTVSYGNSANLTIENGQVYAERVHVGEKIYTVFEEEYNASDSDQIYSMMDTIFHRKNVEVEADNWDALERYGIGGSDGDIFFRSDIYGASIDFKFIPDFGYQLRNIYTNEDEQNSLLSQFEANAERVSSFTLDVVHGNNVHFEVKFVQAENTVNGNAGISSQATIASSNAASSGALEMTVDTATPNSSIPEGSEALAAYDITLKNVVSKGEGRGNWETALTDLGSGSATITLPVEDTTNYTYSVIREHDGTSETLDATVTADGISFETNKFSTYTIVKKPVAKSIATAEVTLGDALTYNGNPQTQTVSSVKLGETTLNDSTDYEITDASKTEAGTYTLTVTGKGDYKDSVTKQFTIAKASLTPSLTGTLTKDYDGLVTVSDASSLTISLADKFGSDDVNASAEKYEFADATVGTGKTITASGITISGSKAANYELSATTTSAAVGTISKVTPTLTLTNLSETTQGARGASAIVMPGDVTANVKIEYYVVKKAAVAAQAEIPCTVEHEASCASLEAGKTLADCDCEKAHTIHTAECGYKAAVEAQAAEYEWTETRPLAPGTYDVRASLPVGTTNLNAVTTYVTGSYRLTQYVAPSSDDDDDDDDSQNTEEPKTEVSTAETVATPASAPIVRTAPNITAVEPTIEAAKENLTVPSENIEAEVPEGISEESKENLVEQVAETVSELVDAILAGDEAVENAVSEETLENIKEALDEGKTIIAVVKAEVVDESSIPSEDKASIEEVISKETESNIEVACYLDLSIMLKTTEGDELGTYNELTGMVTFTIEAPKDMPCPEGKEYVVIRIHNGESTILPVTVNADGTLSFETNEFSTYALAFMDKREVAVTSVVKEELQKSSDTTDKGTVITPSVQEEPIKDKPKGWLWAVLGLIVIVGSAAVFFALKKKDE